MASVAAPPGIPVGEKPDLLTEIRVAGPAEKEAARALQREAFGLEPGPFPPHPGSGEEVRVVLRDGAVVSCLTVIHAQLCARGTLVPIAGIRHVATGPEERNQGYAGSLIRDTLRAQRRRGVVASLLFPFSFRYYRKFGYELGGNHCQFWCRPTCVPAYVERHGCRPAAPQDAARLEECYRRKVSGWACTLARDARRWDELLQDPELSITVTDAGADEGALSGFAVWKECRDAYGGRVLKILDLGAVSPTAWRSILGCVSQTPAESIEWCASAADLTASGLLRSPAPLREGFKPRGVATIRPMFQVRVLDVEEALRARAKTAPPGSYRLALKIQDELLPENSQAVAIQGGGTDGNGAEGAAIRRARPTDPRLEMDIRVFSQIFCGYLSPGEAVSQGLARSSSPAGLEAAEMLFPADESFLAELDRF